MSWKNILKRDDYNWEGMEEQRKPKKTKYKEPYYYQQKPWKGHAHAERISAKEWEKETGKLINEPNPDIEEDGVDMDFPERVEVDDKQWFLLSKLGNMGVYSINRVKRDEEGWQLKPAKEGDLDKTITLSIEEAQEAAI